MSSFLKYFIYGVSLRTHSINMTETKKANVLLVGGGAVGAVAALNVETGGLGEVSAVLRSNYMVVKEKGYTIESVDHGKLKGWRPSKG